jgi:hypothetical protein
MSNKKIDEISTAEFNAIVDAFIERESQDCGELPANVFYEALENIFRQPEKVMTNPLLDAAITPGNLNQQASQCAAAPTDTPVRA